MNHDYLKQIAEELADEHPAKFLFLFEQPTFICWFVGRIRDLCEGKVSDDVITAVILEMIK